MADRRFVSLDVLRGIAILGTLGTNIWIFTNVEGLVGYLSDPTQADGAWRVAQVLLEQLAQGKFLGLLTIMFGIGLAIQQASATRGGRPWPGRYYWRAILLFIDGTLNYLLFTEFDVLMGTRSPDSSSRICCRWAFDASVWRSGLPPPSI